MCLGHFCSSVPHSVPCGGDASVQRRGKDLGGCSLAPFLPSTPSLWGLRLCSASEGGKCVLGGSVFWKERYGN